MSLTLESLGRLRGGCVADGVPGSTSSGWTLGLLCMVELRKRPRTDDPSLQAQASNFIQALSAHGQKVG